MAALFYAMTRDLQAVHFVLPATTSYNGSDIPYAYSPLAFYLAGLADSFTPLSLMDVFRFLPLVITTATVGAVAMLAHEMRLGRLATVASIVAFAVAPRSFIWLLMGGGVTRSLGMLFAIVAVWASLRLAADGRIRRAAVAGAALGLVALSHLGTMPFACLGATLAFAARNRSRVIVSAYVSFAAVKLRDWRLTGEGYNRESQATAEVGGMQWIEGHTRPDVRFLVLTAAPWASDRSSEWFPALQSCAQADASCLNAWARQTHNRFDYVYIPAPTFPYVCCAPLLNALVRDRSYDVAYAKGAWVFKRRELADSAEAITRAPAAAN